MPAALVPFPATLLAVLVLPPRVPKSVTMKIGSPLTRRRVQMRTATAVKQSLICIFMREWSLRKTPVYRKKILATSPNSVIAATSDESSVVPMKRSALRKFSNRRTMRFRAS